MKRNFVILIAIITIVLPSLTFSQWANKWSSSGLNPQYAAGWVAFQKSGDNWINKFYVVTETSFYVMDGEFSENIQYSYAFTAPEKTAGNQVYSLGVDLTGDGIVEFYVLGYHGDADNYRSSFKIIDIVTGSTVFEMDDLNFSFSYPVIWDIDDDGKWDCSFSQYNYPNYETYSYQVYSTDIPTSVAKGDVVQLNFKLNQNYPNPFNPSTTIKYSINEPGNVSINIYDISGSLVKELYSGYKNPGDYQVAWNGQNSKGGKIASGTYFYQIDYNGKKLTKKMLLLK
ncbi:MAG: T9SS type A sorting domain-containing protein [Chlorobi bacterium]|nr:T9SS type A sorting domain-containing protein [Chlorobiota bacterium]